MGTFISGKKRHWAQVLVPELFIGFSQRFIDIPDIGQQL